MASLDAAHRGYAYQDLLVACKLVDVLLGTVVEISVDKKLFPTDLFDDLTTVDAAGRRERSQIKHTDNGGRALSVATFTRNDRRLRLDSVIASVLADRDGPGLAASGHSYRIVLRDAAPTDPRLASVLVPASNDPGSFVPGMRSVRLAFSAEALWSQMERASVEAGHSDCPFAFLGGGVLPLSRVDLDWVCDRLVVEMQAPASSGDLREPAEAEALLLRRVREEVGTEMFPNADRSAVDVSASMTSTADAARQGRLVVTAPEILRRAHLRSDFGAVARLHPVDRSLEVARDTAVRRVADLAAEMAETGGAVLVVGPPGQGKSWLCQQFLEYLSDCGWLTAEHYCYLGAADHERTERVLADGVFGSLVNRMALADPRIVDDLRPRFAVDDDALVGCIARSVELEPDRKVAVVVDGIDHVTRVLGGRGGSDPPLRLAERLASLEMPANSVLIVLSQPGPHLVPLEESGAETVEVEGLDRAETERLAARLGLVPSPRDAGGAEAPLVEDGEEVAAFVDALTARSGGNALYTTYLCREALRHDITLAAPAAAVLGLPPFDETLKGYYEQLRESLDAEGGQVADVVALLDFAVSREELRSILPEAAHRVDRALELLAPVLVERAAQGGIRVYHESFARHLCEAFQHDDDARCALLKRVTDWLGDRGFFNDARAFRHLISLLGDAGRDSEAVSLVERDFVARSVAAGFPASEVVSNLASAIGCAARLGDWPAVIRCVELSRAALSYQADALDPLLADYADVLIAVLGPDVVAERLVHDERAVMQIGTGLRMCAAVDAAGAVAPWRHYLTSYSPGNGSDDSVHDGGSSLAADVAWLRGWLRLAGLAAQPRPPTGHALDDSGRSAAGESSPILDPAHLGAPIDWHGVARFVKKYSLPASAVAETLLDTHGARGLRHLVELLDRPTEMCLAVAEHVKAHEGVADLGDARSWALDAASGGSPPGELHTVLSLGVGLSDLDGFPVEGSLERLRGLARKVQEGTITWESEPLDAWLDECTAAARQDTLILNAAEALIEGEGWYRCWLRFTTGLARAEAAAADRPGLALEALSHLESDLDPFVGEPRACDLFKIHHTIRHTIRRAVALTGEKWTEAIRLLSRVSNAVTVTLSGSIGGPVPPAFVLGLAVDGVTGANRHRRAVAAELLEAEISEQSAMRHYPDLAEYRLLEARLALAADDLDEARRLWDEACRLMTGYGWHKDITIYELLDPLEMLIDVDRDRGRARLASAQALCERVRWHTDGKGTSHAPQRWWRLLAQADPAALARLAARRLLRKCNAPSPLWHQALTDMWRSWHTDADPLLAGALRLTLETPLGPGDVEALERLAASEAADGAGDGLMVWLLARADERPATHSDPEIADIDARDRQLLAGLNFAAESRGLPPVIPVGGSPTGSTGHLSPSDDPAQDHGPRVADLPVIPVGEAGLAKSIRVWRARPYKPDGPCWDTAEFAKEIAERLIGLAEAGRFRDAVYYLRLLADASWSREGARLLRKIADGLEQRDQMRLAAAAHTLAWTRSGGDYGYGGFGGETGISSLRRASDIDPALALEIVAAETESIIAVGNYGTYGFSKTLIHAFGVGALTPLDSSPLDTAFAAWDEIRTVTDYRAPRVHDADDPTDAYTPDSDADGDVSQSELDDAFTLGVFGGLGHASREKKRRTLLAVELLLSERPTQAAAAADFALSELSDPATLAWLLRVMETSSTPATPLITACRQTLVQLAGGEHLVVRALARRLLQDDAPPLPPPAADDKELLTGTDALIWTPADHDEDSYGAHPTRAAEMVRIVAGSRLRSAEATLPGLRRAVELRVADAIASDDYRDQLRIQRNHYSSASDPHWPDAYLYGEQTVEDALQRAACAGRTVRIQMRQAGDPAAWEDGLASLLLDDPEVPLALETRRVPRPPLPAPPQPGVDRWSSAPTATTLSLEPADIAWVETLIQVRGWPLIATLELQTFQHPDPLDRREVAVIRHRVPELRDAAGIKRIESLPAAGDIRRWVADLHDSSDVRPLVGAMSIFGLDQHGEYIGDGRQGLGIQTPVLAPADALLVTFGLHPSEPFKLDDSHGGGMALVTWRTAYDDGALSLPRPRLIGSGVTAHPDLIRRLIAHSDSKLVVRDFIAATPL